MPVPAQMRFPVTLMSRGRTYRSRIFRTLCLLIASVVLIFHLLNAIPISSWTTTSSRDAMRENVNGSQTSLSFSSPLHLKRIQNANAECFKRKLESVKRVIMDRRKQFAMCIIPKASCTAWINVFLFINQEKGHETYRSPSDIPRYVTHYSPGTSDEYRENGKMMTDTPYIGDSFRFMFVRDPYKRLWSAWIDKFLLNDFWFTAAAETAKYLKLTSRETRCATNITFVQFLRFVSHQQNMQSMNSHWAPCYVLCDPCVFRPHFIGKVETFQDDSSIALSQMMKKQPSETVDQQSGIHQNNYREPHSGQTNDPHHKETGWHEIMKLSEYTFFISKGPRFAECGISWLFIAQRLWKGFQYNGHIPDWTPLNMTQWEEKSFYRVLEQAYTSWGMDPGIRAERQKKQRDRWFAEGYKEVPLILMKRLKAIYKHDFLQFGYDQEPEELFAWR